MPIIHPASGREIISVPSSVRSELAWLSSWMASEGIDIPDHSEAAAELGMLKRYAQYHDTGATFANGDDYCDTVRCAHSISRLIRHCSVLDRTPGWRKKLADMWTGSGVNLIGAVPRRPTRDVAWEVTCAGAMRGIGGMVECEEPDVIGLFRGTRWGLACKKFYTTSVRTQIDAIAKGVKQLESSRADYGAVVVDLSALIDHSEFLESRQAGMKSMWTDPQQAYDVLRARVRPIIARLDTQHAVRRYRRGKGGTSRSKARAILFVATSVAETKEMPWTIGITTMFRFRALEGPEMEFLNEFSNRLDGPPVRAHNTTQDRVG